MKPDKAETIGTGILAITGQREGPTIAAICNIHGNEPCGRRAVQSLLRSHRIEAGRLVLVDGNPDAALLGRRFVDADMNRMFTVSRLGSDEHGPDIERARYLAETLPALGIDLAIDFHSVISATAHPFVISFPGTEPLAERCPMPRIYGWRGIVEGTLCEWLCDRDVPTVVVEAGQHDTSAAVRCSEDTLLSVLSHHGLIQLEKPVSFRRQRGFDVLENVQIRDFDSFSLKGDYASFDPLHAGEVIAEDRTGPYAAPHEEGLAILMPTTMEAVRNRTAAGAYYLMRERAE